MKSYDEIWGTSGHLTPMSWLVDYDVTVLRNGQRIHTSVKMMSHNEWEGRVKRVVALRNGWNEDSFELVQWRLSDG